MLAQWRFVFASEEISAYYTQLKLGGKMMISTQIFCIIDKKKRNYVGAS
jgi:hypothetical protein